MRLILRLLSGEASWFSKRPPDYDVPTKGKELTTQDRENPVASLGPHLTQLPRVGQMVCRLQVLDT